ncbi:NAD(P)/FAD-dependent oxidoreductase [Halorussus marinus]|uniref:NAD(P)/FAD-dependent oxidoreductase n=1 Tax=Halorussus marinus TaxID=2505976 RepID=UPI001091D897|nr:FAD-dependent oxidoreductase [Halorussus marinus]
MRIGIIGGGIYGTAIAYFLQELGDVEVALFERQEIGGKSTSRSAGIVRHHYARQGHIKLAKRGREILENLETYVGQKGGFRQNGYLALTGEKNEELFHETIEKQKQIGLDVRLVEPSELGNYIPGIDSSGVTAAAFEREAGFADPYLVAQGFSKAAQESGADLRSRTEVTDIEIDRGVVTAVETTNGTEEVDFLVNAAGPWGAEVGQMVGLDIPLTWYESKAVVLSSTNPYDIETPTLSDSLQQMYVKPEPGGDFIVGGIDRPEIDRDVGLEGITIDYLNQVQKALKRRMSTHADAEVIESWSGIITATPDWYQIVGVPDGYENFYNIVGGSGHGFKEAPGFAESIAQEILGNEPNYDLSPYRLERYEEGELLSDLEMARKKND